MKYKLLFLDTETTGNEEGDHLCQVAYSDGSTRKSALFKPPVPISFESMAVHHITEKMVAGKPKFQFSVEYKELHEKFHDGETIFIAHNAPFDLKMLKKEGLIPDYSIDTLRLARFLDPEEKIPSYRLQYLRYFLDLEINEVVTAHDALEQMMKISSEPSLIRSFKFGKYNGTLVADVAVKDLGYLEWLLKQKLETSPDDEDWIYTLKFYLNK